MTELVNELSITVPFNDEVLQEIAKKHNTDTGTLFEDFEFKETMANALALTLEKELQKEDTRFSWELLLCISRQIINNMEIEEEEVNEVLYMNNLLPGTTNSIKIKAYSNIPLQKEGFKQLVIETLIKMVQQVCQMNEITIYKLKRVLEALLE